MRPRGTQVSATIFTGAASARVLDCSDRKSTRLNSSHSQISYAVFCLKKKLPVISANQENEGHFLDLFLTFEQASGDIQAPPRLPMPSLTVASTHASATSSDDVQMSEP